MGFFLVSDLSGRVLIHRGIKTVLLPFTLFHISALFLRDVLLFCWVFWIGVSTSWDARQWTLCPLFFLRKKKVRGGLDVKPSIDPVRLGGGSRFLYRA